MKEELTRNLTTSFAASLHWDNRLVSRKRHLRHQRCPRHVQVFPQQTKVMHTPPPDYLPAYSLGAVDSLTITIIRRPREKGDPRSCKHRYNWASSASADSKPEETSVDTLGQALLVEARTHIAFWRADSGGPSAGTIRNAVLLAATSTSGRIAVAVVKANAHGWTAPRSGEM